MVVGSVRDDPEQARSMSGSGVSAAKQRTDGSGRLEVRGSGLGKCVDQPVRPPVNGGERVAISNDRVAYGIV